MKFLCDEMLQRLGHWLRLAGYDTFIENNGRSDYEILRQAIEEQRYLLTRDRKILEHRRASGTVILLPEGSLDDMVKSLSEQLPIDWLFQPFVRCSVCNTKLDPATEAQRQLIPQDMKDKNVAAFYCPTCEQVYWDGGHVQRMRHKLEYWHTLYNQ